MRSVILHYHIYKNAGTSFDHVLSHSFGDRHEAFDGPYPFFVIDQEQLDRTIMRRPGAVAFSSHQIVLPPPSSVDYRPLSAIFVRNPFLRIASVYRFKRGPETGDGTPVAALPPEAQPAALRALNLPEELATNMDVTSTAVAARRLDFAGWLGHCLDSAVEIVNVSNAQMRFFSSPYRMRPTQRRTATGMEYDLGTALRTLSGVELLGRTEHFDADVARFARILGQDHAITLTIPPDTRKNVTEAPRAPTAQRVEALLSSLPAGLRRRFEAANAQDLALYERACALIESDHRP